MKRNLLLVLTHYYTNIFQLDGFYVECGALDGELRSNTLFFERKRGWKGLLIEADPKNYDKMVNKHRKAYMSPTCLAPTPHPTVVCVSVKHLYNREE